MKYGIINRIYEKVYNLRCHKVIGAGVLYNLLLKFCDPIIKTRINNQDCFVHFSHQGVYYINVFPDYDRNIGRICSYLKKTLGRQISIVDIGANVGDTILCIGDKSYKYYAVEGEKRYYSLLKYNLREYDYELIKSYLGDKDELQNCSIDYSNGTGAILTNVKDNQMEIKKADSIFLDKPFIDFVKIDTDGYDFSVIRGMKELIKSFRPVVYFEWTAPELINNNEDLVSVFSLFDEWNYEKCLIFDKYGNFMCSQNISNISLLKQLINYSLKADIYYDVCVFPTEMKIDIKYLINAFQKKGHVQ